MASTAMSGSSRGSTPTALTSRVTVLVEEIQYTDQEAERYRLSCDISGGQSVDRVYVARK